MSTIKSIFVISMLMLTACASIAPTPTDSGIEGQALIGPMCPVMQVGQECPDQPYQALLTVTTTSGKRIAQVQTDENGYFKIPLAPGEYILHPKSQNALPHAGEQSVLVEAGKFTKVTVQYDSGIR